MATRTKEPVQRAAHDEATGQGRPPLSPELLQRLYCNMVKSRMVEEQIVRLSRNGKLACPYVAATGLEATEVGATIDLHCDDALAPSRRSLVAHITRGMPLKYIFAQLLSRKTKQKSNGTACEPRLYPIPDSAVAAHLNLGTGMALAYRMQKKANVVVSLPDAPCTSLDAWREPLTFAGRYKLPIIFVMENNLWAEPATAGVAAGPDELTREAQAYGFPVMTVDGNDVVAVYRVCYEARERARQGYGPTLVESRTWRWYGHSGNETAQHRSPEELQEWTRRDPVPAMERYLRKQNLWDEHRNRQFLKEVNAELREALAFAKKTSRPLPDDALLGIYSL